MHENRGDRRCKNLRRWRCASASARCGSSRHCLGHNRNSTADSVNVCILYILCAYASVCPSSPQIWLLQRSSKDCFALDHFHIARRNPLAHTHAHIELPTHTWCVHVRVAMVHKALGTTHVLCQHAWHTHWGKQHSSLPPGRFVELL